MKLKRLLYLWVSTLSLIFLLPLTTPVGAAPAQSSLDQLFQGTANQEGTLEHTPAYIYSELVSVANGKVTITAGAANIRKGNSASTKVLRVGYRGESFGFLENVLSFDTGTPWVKIQYREGSSNAPEGTRWGTVEVSSHLRIRTEPWGNIIGRLYNGERVQVDLSQSKKYWYKIFRGGTSGYAHKNYIVLDGESGQTEKPEKPKETTPPPPSVTPPPAPAPSGGHTPRRGRTSRPGSSD